MKIKSITFLLASLLLFTLTIPAIACDCEGDPPGECYKCQDGDWVQYGDCWFWGGCPDCESCEDCWCSCTSECCGDSYCPDCYTCVGCHLCVCLAECGCLGYSCSSECEECENCECQLKAGAQCKTSLNCPMCYDCIDCKCEYRCESGECCDEAEDMCIDSCTEDGQCDYGELPIAYANCPSFQDPITNKCNEGEDALCDYVVDIALNDAQCASCEPNCDKDRVSYCVKITSCRCTTHCYGWVCACICDVKPEEYYTYGNQYQCAD